MAEYISYYNGEYIPDSECTYHVGSGNRAFIRGDSVYDVARTFNYKIHRLRDHVKRLYRSLNFARIDPGLTIDEMEDISNEVLRRNESLQAPGGDVVVWQTITRGWPNFMSSVTDAAPSNVCVSVRPIDFSGYAQEYKTGGHVVLAKTRSHNSQAIEPKLKHTSRMNFSLADLEAADIDPEAHAVLLDQDGNITENTSGNFFIVTDGVIRTSTDQSILAGVGRTDVLELAARLGIPTSEENLQPYDAYTADESFLSNSLYCVLPVAQIDKRNLEGDVPGPITERLLAAWSEEVGLDIVDQALHHIS